MSFKLPLPVTAILSLSCLLATAPAVFADAGTAHCSGHEYQMLDVSMMDDAGTVPAHADHLNKQKYGVVGIKSGLGSWVIRYDNKMFRGGAIQDSSGIDSLKELGVETVFAITATDEERALVQGAGISLIEFPFEKRTPMSEDSIEKFIQLLSIVDTPVYVHCGLSKHRAGVLGLIYRLHTGWTPQDALLEFAFLGGSLIDDYPMIESVLETYKDKKIDVKH